jgi:hypothetical protein
MPAVVADHGGLGAALQKILAAGPAEPFDPLLVEILVHKAADVIGPEHFPRDRFHAYSSLPVRRAIGIVSYVDSAARPVCRSIV